MRKMEISSSDFEKRYCLDEKNGNKQ